MIISRTCPTTAGSASATSICAPRLQASVPWGGIEELPRPRVGSLRPGPHFRRRRARPDRRRRNARHGARHPRRRTGAREGATVTQPNLSASPITVGRGADRELAGALGIPRCSARIPTAAGMGESARIWPGTARPQFTRAENAGGGGWKDAHHDRDVDLRTPAHQAQASKSFEQRSASPRG